MTNYQIIDGKAISDQIKQEIASEVENVVFGFGMVNVIIGGYPHEKSKKSTNDMLARYAQSFVV